MNIKTNDINWMFVFPQNIYVENLIPKVMILRDGVLGEVT
jgi:hypothetical protein